MKAYILILRRKNKPREQFEKEVRVIMKLLKKKGAFPVFSENVDKDTVKVSYCAKKKLL